MRVLITGANGQLGGALERLAPAWAGINAIDVDDCDLNDVPMLRARLVVEAPELIINAAAYTAVDKAESDEDLARAINADAVAAMVEAMAETGGKMVHVSTDFVFDGDASAPYAPASARNPLSAYGRTKAEGEDYLRPEDLLVRTAWVYEAGGANFVRTMIRLMSERDELAVVPDQTGAPTWATGLARTIWALVRNARPAPITTAMMARRRGTNLRSLSLRRPMRSVSLPASPRSARSLRRSIQPWRGVRPIRCSIAVRRALFSAMPRCRGATICA